MGDFMKNANLVLLKEQLKKIKELGWIKNQRPGNVGGVGNTLEDLLGIEENNLQLPDFGEWELKSQRDSTSALLTLFHMEPKPRTAKIVKNILLKNYGWPHQKAGIKYPLDERSFRQTINVLSYSDRGFRVNIDYKQEKIFVNFNFSKINDRHDKWRMYLAQGIGKGDLHPHPFWTFNDLENKLKKKLSNLMYVHVKTKYENGIEYFKYN